ncbi:MAG: SIMPL domain-containing protein [Anaerolineales bacterium]|nr:SIMPL domain-containing protein [Anaerolineales bacterium]
METKPDTIKISANYQEEIFATHADLHVTVKGSSIVGGNEALKKAKEVNQLFEALTQLNVKEEAFQLQGAHLESESGVLLKSSSAVYRLKIRCEALSQLAGMLDVIAAQKNATLEHIEWKYAEDEARERGLLAALEKAKAKAAKVAASLGVDLLGVYEMSESAYDNEPPPYAPQMRMLKAASADAPSLGMEIQHAKIIRVTVDVCYRVSAFAK